MLKTSERTQDKIEYQKRLLDSVSIGLRVAAPGIIQAVDYGKQTCTVQLAIRERLNFDGNLQWTEIPLLPDVPFFVYSGGGYCLTLPITVGDDCLVVFGDNCMDAWWQNGGVQNQIERRRHDLSDGFALVGFKSQPNVVSGFSGSSAQLRNASGSACIEISGDTINISAANVNVNGKTVISGGTTIDGKNFLGHMHKDVQSGSSDTGGVS
ncbi:Gp138 family membrane-puncturing spike protein [Pectinatus haikarae]|uniref:Phage protein Gp138 N-terminal domain-containing protein n=1 Tax=Pectinatus haikarae TaxID=349096 RepID=A0ABT9Y4N5_9FIRM|nr:Gp138 family membrane-puncturing spike protein [Pectinatus haikarae]MDQ0202470.1 hypothetical protein [Pectinatus haikarae]